MGVDEDKKKDMATVTCIDIEALKAFDGLSNGNLLARNLEYWWNGSGNTTMEIKNYGRKWWNL